VLVDLVVVTYTIILVREYVDSQIRRSYRNAGRGLNTSACRAQEFICQELKLPKEIRDFIFGQDP
jgi:hypothetical protein